MRKHLTTTTKANELKLLYRHPSSKGFLWVLVEGISDVKLFSKFIPDPSVHIEEAYGGKPDLIKAVEELRNDSTRFLGIVDADFEWLEETVPSNWHSILRTDWHDIEMSMIFDDDAFKACIAEVSPSHLESFNEIRSNVVCSCDTIGALRYFNSLNDVDFNFKGFTITKVWEASLSGVCAKKLSTEVNGSSPSKKIPAVESQIGEILSKGIESKHLSCGHDFANILAFIFQEQGHGISGKSIEAFLRVGYSIDKFNTTNISQRLFAWITQEKARMATLELT